MSYNWYYIKDFAMFNVYGNINSLPSELVHYVYSYIINNKFKKYTNCMYIYNNINQQLDNNLFWRNKYQYFLQLLNLPYSKNVEEEITINMDKIPYPSFCDINILWCYIEKIVEHKYYTNITYKLDGKLWASGYTDMKNFGLKCKHITDNIDSLTVKINSKEKLFTINNYLQQIFESTYSTLYKTT